VPKLCGNPGHFPLVTLDAYRKDIAPRSTIVWPSRVTVAPLSEPTALMRLVFVPPAQLLPPVPRVTIPDATHDTSLLPGGTLTLGLMPMSMTPNSSLPSGPAS
jgi:hypothetical protein